jgi:Holliday junction resolvasome RuvABC ATP-dependent DNA helicase subunit
LTLEVPAVHARRRNDATGLLTTPLRDRFGMTFRLEYYEPADWA